MFFFHAIFFGEAPTIYPEHHKQDLASKGKNNCRKPVKICLKTKTKCVEMWQILPTHPHNNPPK